MTNAPRMASNDNLSCLVSWFSTELSLAYNVVNTTNGWAITLVGALTVAVLTRGTYPTVGAWLTVIGAIILMNRFFVRSCLGYVNLSRWNKLMKATLAAQAATEGDRQRLLGLLNRSVQMYYGDFFSPVPQWNVLRDNLKLAYLWIYLLLFILAAWGFVAINAPFALKCVVGVTLAAATIIEVGWFRAARMFTYRSIDGADGEATRYA